MSESVDLDARLDELFATPPSGFVSARDALVKELRRAGLAEPADAVKALKRPTLAVAALNRASRAEPAMVAELVEVGEQLATLQGERSVDRDELRDLTRRRRALLDRVTDVAAATTERPESSRSSIAATLDSASVDEWLRDDLLRGRLTQELSPATRFVFADGAPSAPRQQARARSTSRSRPTAPRRDELAVRRARAELEAVQERAATAAERSEETTISAAEASAALDAAVQRVADLEAALVEARAALVEAKRTARDAERTQRRVRTEVERLNAALRAAERAVSDAEG